MIYESVKRVLAALDAQGLADHDDWNDQVAASLAALECSYRELRNVDRDLIDYSDLATQAAYVFRYVLGHAQFVYDFLKHARSTTGTPLFDRKEVWVSSIGGGPGSELLGLIKYLSEDDSEPEIKKIVYTVIDKESNWEHVVRLFIEVVNPEIEVELYFQIYDASAVVASKAVSLKDEELVIMSFFISEVCEIPGKVRVISNLNKLLSTMKANAILLYNDSSAYSFYTFFNNRIQAAKRFDQIIDLEAQYKTEAPIYDGIMDEYVEQFDYRPRLSSKAVTKLLRRTE